MTISREQQLEILRKMSDDQIDFSDAPEATDEQLSNLSVFVPPKKKIMTIKLDEQAFQRKVLMAVNLISSAKSLEQSELVTFEPEQEIRASSTGFQESENEAKKIVSRRDIRKLICPALKSITNDSEQIATKITPILIGAIIAETIVMPLNPILFGWIAIVIARGSIASICTDYSN